MKGPGTIACALALGLGLAACGSDQGSAPPPPTRSEATRARPAAPPGPPPIAVLEVAGLGTIRVALRPDEAPETVANFEKLARSGFYDGTTFHRVIPEFMIQGGDPNTKNRDPRDDGRGGPGYTIPDEPNGLSHERGAISMANAGRNTGGSQFFIVLTPQPHLNPRHTVFGNVVEGMDVVDAIAAVETDRYGRHGPRDRPLENVVVASVQIERAEAEAGSDAPAAAPSAEAPNAPDAPDSAGTPGDAPPPAAPDPS